MAEEHRDYKSFTWEFTKWLNKKLKKPNSGDKKDQMNNNNEKIITSGDKECPKNPCVINHEESSYQGQSL